MPGNGGRLIPVRGLLLGPPKSRAGRAGGVFASRDPARRTSAARGVRWRGARRTGLHRSGSAIRRGNLNKLTRWSEAVSAIGASGLHFHDPRHTGNTMAARTGASTRELMARMGHDSAQAALIYQHAPAEADREIAAKVNAAVKGRATAGRQGDQAQPEAPRPPRRRSDRSACGNDPMARRILARPLTLKTLDGTSVLTRVFGLERVKGIEPSLSAWEADVLPLNYTRERVNSTWNGGGAHTTPITRWGGAGRCACRGSVGRCRTACPVRRGGRATPGRPGRCGRPSPRRC
jgi:hypothetical protein